MASTPETAAPQTGKAGTPHPSASSPEPVRQSGMAGVLNLVERVGNRVPHPVVIFVMLIGLVVVLSHVFYLMGTTVAFQAINPETHQLEDSTVTARSLLTGDGIRFMYSTVIQNFMGFTAVGVIIVAMLGVGVAEAAGLITALIRKLVEVAPPGALTYILVFVGIVSSIAADAGYLVLIPLGAAAYLSVGRHPLAGLAATFSAVAAVFTVNIFVKPLDGILVGITNDAIHILDPNRSISLTSNLWFAIASVVLLTVVVSVVNDRIVEPRLGTYSGDGPGAEQAGMTAQESRGLKFATWGLLATLALFGLLALPPGAPLRHAATGALIGDSPFMNGLIVFIAAVFLAGGAAYGIGAGTMKGTVDVVKAMEKAVTGLGGLLFLLFVISQFNAFFGYTNMATLVAVNLGDGLESAGLGALPLLLGLVVVVAILDLVMTGSIPKWAIFAPIFVPLLIRLGVAPEAALAAYRVGDSPLNALTPMNPYFALIVSFAAKYQKDAGVGTVIALMLPHVAALFLLWPLLLVAWQVLGLPWGF
jgi:aminobenzoyl-glutamate transport protein